jgi:hypothetical protein
MVVGRVRKCLQIEFSPLYLNTLHHYYFSSYLLAFIIGTALSRLQYAKNIIY